MSVAIGGIDACLLVAYLAGVVLFGIWLGRGQRSLTDYLLGGRNLPWWAVLGSIVATETSTVTFLSIPGIAFDRTAPNNGDLRFLQLALGIVIGRCLIVFLFLPSYFRGDLFTAYEVLDRRFGGSVKRTASLMFIVTRTLADGLRLYLTALVLAEVAGLSLSLCVTVIGAGTVAYTFAGGMRSVVWNDCVQLVVYVGGALLAAFVILDRLPGGWGQYVAFAAEGDRFRMFDPSLDFSRPYTLWAGIVGGMFLTLATHGTDQLMVQRYLSARRQRDAALALVLSGTAVFVQFALFLLVGLGLACFYAEFPLGEPVANDRVFARFIVTELPAGAVGITLAAVFAAAMSTLSSSLNSSAAAAVRDFRPSGGGTERRMDGLWSSRLWTVVFGLAQTGVAIGAGVLGMRQSVIDSVLAIAGFATGLILGVFFLGVLTRRAGQGAALAGLAFGLAVVSTVAFGEVLARLASLVLEDGHIVVEGLAAAGEIAWPWYTVVGAFSTFAAGAAAASLCRAGRHSG